MDKPMYSFPSGACNTKRELKRLRKILAQAGLATGSRLFFSLCFLSKGQQRKLKRKAARYDKVLTLCCTYGKANVQACLGDTEAVGAMKMRGYLRTSGSMKGLSMHINPDDLYINNKHYAEGLHDR